MHFTCACNAQSFVQTNDYQQRSDMLWGKISTIHFSLIPMLDWKAQPSNQTMPDIREISWVEIGLALSL